MRVSEFYEAYWQKDYAPPQGDPTSAERMVHLEATLRSLLPNPRSGTRRVLDAGCGDGAFLAFLRQRGFRVSGFELATGAAARARRRCPDADIRIASLEERLRSTTMTTTRCGVRMCWSTSSGYTARLRS
jgi:SAM-dependent methyltransferase